MTGCRKLPDHLLMVFHRACDEGDFEVAQPVLTILEDLLRRPVTVGPPERRKLVDAIVAAHERLWHLRRAASADVPQHLLRRSA
jgi:hypothetical protein